MDFLVFDKPFMDGPLLAENSDELDYLELSDPFLTSLLEGLEDSDFSMEEDQYVPAFGQQEASPECYSQQENQNPQFMKAPLTEERKVKKQPEPKKLENNIDPVKREKDCDHFDSYHKLAMTSSFVSTSTKGRRQCSCPFPGCSNKSPNEASLSEHMELHRKGGARYFGCQECTSVFYSAGSLKSHQSTHSKVRHKYFCKKANCGKSYATVEGLRLHNRNYHEINKPWRCFHSDCGASFVRKSDLKLHIVRMHITERPFPCTIDGCTRRFACHSELRRHLSKFHRIKLPKPSKHSFKNPKLPVLDRLLRMAEIDCAKGK